MILEIGLRIATIIVAIVLGYFLQHKTKDLDTEYGWLYRLTYGALGFVAPFVLAEWIFKIY